MSKNVDRMNKRGVKSSYISTIIGISLVLFMIGIVMGGFLGLDNVQKQAKESLQGDLFFIPEMNPSDIKQIEQELKTWVQFNEVFYVSPERAIEEFTGEDENADNILAIFEGENPLPPTIGFGQNRITQHSKEWLVLRIHYYKCMRPSWMRSVTMNQV